MRKFWTGCAAAALILTGCSTNPATGKKQVDILNMNSEIAMGSEAAPEVLQQYGGKFNNPDVQNYTAEVGKKLAAVTEGDNPQLPWEFTMLDSDVINAFSLPGGKVFFSRGLAAQLQNEAQFAAVLGHEVGHVTARHINDQMFRNTVAGVGTELASTLLEGYGGAAAQVAPQVIQLGSQTFLLRFSRKQELEADELGMRYMAKVGYDPSAIEGVMQVLANSMKGDRSPEMLSTHPYPETRIEAIRERMKDEYAELSTQSLKTNAAQYQQRMLSKLGGGKKAQLAPGEGVLASLGDPVLWCAHCREAMVAGR